MRAWRPERDRHVLVLLDTGRTAAGLVGSGSAAVPRLAAALDAALLPAALASRGRDRVELLAHDRLSRASVFGARDPLPRIWTIPDIPGGRRQLGHAPDGAPCARSRAHRVSPSSP